MPRTAKIVCEDDVTLLGVIVSIFGLLFLPMTLVGIPSGAYLGLLLFPVGLAVVFFRIRHVREAFALGEEVLASVTDCRGPIPKTGQFILRLAYDVGGIDYVVKKAVSPTRFGLKRFRHPFAAGDEVVIFVHPRHRRSVFLRDRFLY